MPSVVKLDDDLEIIERSLLVLALSFQSFFFFVTLFPRGFPLSKNFFFMQSHS